MEVRRWNAYDTCNNANSYFHIKNEDKDEDMQNSWLVELSRRNHRNVDGYSNHND